MSDMTGHSICDELSGSTTCRPHDARRGKRPEDPVPKVMRIFLPLSVLRLIWPSLAALFVNGFSNAHLNPRSPQTADATHTFIGDVS